jgi:2-oxoisovalerate dehydrogenase E1 component
VTFTHLPGLRVLMPSNALDACGLLRTALRSDDPVLFLEHKKLYREPYNRSPHPGPDFTIPFGKAKVVKAGQSLTVITYGALVQKALQAALHVEQKSPESTVEIIDLRSLSPYDWEAISASVQKNNRVIVAYEDTLSWGYGAEIAARIASELFDSLDAPVKRVAALDTWVGYNPQLEAEILPQVEDLVREIEALLAY